jgi:predicted CDP-diglyceride synthetase/phosphatidate cytidylyltransferase
LAADPNRRPLTSRSAGWARFLASTLVRIGVSPNFISVISLLFAVKRSLGAKDWGVMIEGHGGMLDRMDSVSFAAPVFFHVTRFFFT